MEHLDKTPPVIRILLEEDLSRILDGTQYMRRLLPELKRQAEWTMDNWSYFDQEPPTPGPLVITASGGLNPLSRHAVCQAPKCRIAAAETFARTIGLYADVVTVPDSITARLFYNDRLTDEQRVMLAIDMLVVTVRL